MTTFVNMILLITIIFLILFANTFKKIFIKFLMWKGIHKNKDNLQVNIVEIEQALVFLSKNKIGALITFEKKDSLSEYVEKGIKIDGKISKELLISILNKNSPIHDGSIIISKGRIQSCSSFFPSVNKKMESRFGARHRAAIGLTASVDALVLVVSETTGTISYALRGVLKQFDKKDERTIQKELINLIANE